MLAVHVESRTACHAFLLCSNFFAWLCSGCHKVPRSSSSSSNSTLRKSSGRLPNISSKGDAPWTETVSEKALQTRDAKFWQVTVGGNWLPKRLRASLIMPMVLSTLCSPVGFTRLYGDLAKNAPSGSVLINKG